MNRNLEKLRSHSQREALTLKNPLYRKWIQQFTAEETKKDVGAGDITTNVLFPKPKRIHGFVVAKEAGILAGRQEIEFFLRFLNSHPELVSELVLNSFQESRRMSKQVRHDIKFRFSRRDGEPIRKGQHILELNGDVRDLMKIERVILNLIGRMSGIATLTARLTEKVRSFAPNILLTPTRKTLWGLLDKRACVVGGGGTHRLSLDNAILIKHNHIKASGKSFPEFLKDVMLSLSKHDFKRARFFEIEVKNVVDAFNTAQLFSEFIKRKIGHGQFCVMFDNMSPRDISSALKKIKSMGFYNDILFEASGNITEKNLAVYAKTGVDILSLGILTHSAPMLDVSMRIL